MSSSHLEATRSPEDARTSVKRGHQGTPSDSYAWCKRATKLLTSAAEALRQAGVGPPPPSPALLPRGRYISKRDLWKVRQCPGETLRSFSEHFFQAHEQIRDADDDTAISAFAAGVTNQKMIEKLAIQRDKVSSVTALLALADKYAQIEENHSILRNFLR